MRLLPKEAWGYAALLVLLCAIGSIAAWHSIAFVEGLPGEEHRAVAAIIFTLTLGFMLIAGAFGLWATRFSAEAESRRRIGRLVDAMHYISDGVVVTDRRGRITGSNPAAGDLVGAELAKNQMLSAAFACLSDGDASALLTADEPAELERTLSSPRAPRTLRFRAYPSEGLVLILVSDVTAMNARRLRSRQVARLQWIGQIARGVVRDFNNLLCAIAGHAALLRRVRSGSVEMTASIEAIARGAEQGIALTAHLLELSQSRLTGMATDLIDEHVRLAVDTLRYSLSPEWKIEQAVEAGLPPVGVSRMQLEQVILNLGIMAADAIRAPGVLRIAAGKPGSAPPMDVPSRFAAVVIISAERAGAATHPAGAAVPRSADDAGMIESVVSSMLEEAGGAFEAMTSPEGTPVYRVSLPCGVIPPAAESAERVPEDLKAYVAGWSLMVAGREQHRLRRDLAQTGLRAQWVDGIPDALAHIEQARTLDAVVFDSRLLGSQAQPLLRAVLKLRPDAGVVVLSDDIEGDSEGLQGDIAFIPLHAPIGRLLPALVEARGLAARRARR
jgi:PAS domain-containing protein